MLKTTDLRIGNIVYVDVDGDGILSETFISSGHLANMEKYDAKYFPVILTEKILLERCGMNMLSFKASDKFDPTDVKVFGTDEGIIISKLYFPNGGFVFHYKEMKVALKGLHHLQNLFHAIFYSELPIK